MKDYRPRLSVDLTEEQYNRLSALIPWGLKQKLFSTIVDDLITVIEKHGNSAVAAIIGRAVKSGEYLLTERKEDG